jgi:hypothetical protein
LEYKKSNPYCYELKISNKNPFVCRTGKAIPEEWWAKDITQNQRRRRIGTCMNLMGDRFT